MDDEKIQFFGFGTLTLPEIVEAITGHTNIVGHEATLEGYVLGIQSIADLPTEKLKEILSSVWGADFTSYAIAKGDGVIKGVIWELTPRDMELLKNWELVELGWFKECKATATTKDGTAHKVMTLEVDTTQGLTRVNGLSFDPLRGKGDAFRQRFIELATDVRKE